MRQPKSTPPTKQATSMSRLLLSSLLSSGSLTLGDWGGTDRTGDDSGSLTLGDWRGTDGTDDDDVGGSITTDGVGLGVDVVGFCLGSHL